MLHVTSSSVDLAFGLARQHYEIHRFADAEAMCAAILEFDPEHVGALHLSGLLARHDGRAEEAVGLLRRAVELMPQSPEVRYDFAHALQAAARFEEAVGEYRQALLLRPVFAEALDGLGTALSYAERPLEAAEAHRAAIAVRPGFAQAWNNLGNALLATGKREEAIEAYRQAVTLAPELYQPLIGLGAALLATGKLAEAIAVLERAIALRPDLPEGYNNLASALTETECVDAAIAACRKAIELRPDYPEPYSNLGNLLRKQDKLDEAIVAYRKAIELRPEYPEALSNLGGALINRSEFDEATTLFRRAIELKPDFAAANNLLFCLQFLPGNDPAPIYREHALWNKRFAAHLAGALGPPPNDRTVGRRLRVGYVSPDFRNHCQAFFTVPLLSVHDHARFEIFLYGDIACPDVITEQIRGYADTWRDTLGMSDGAFAQLIREDRIDILVDLTMHMAKGRPGVFARKVAPVQVAWLAYPGTTGLTAIDYRLTDPYLDPEGEGANDAFYSEKSVRLPETFWCYDPLLEKPAVSELPAVANGFVTFGCLNNFAKVNDRTIRLWRDVLEAVSASRMKILAPQGGGGLREELVRKLGVDPARIDLLDRRARLAYLALYQGIDLCLDTFPYNGHTTSLDALWMGVPAVTLCGRTAVARAGFSQMTNLGIGGFVARTGEEYVEIAAGWAGRVLELAELRARLRERMQRSPLMDNRRFARNFEQALQTMWATYCEQAL